MYKVPKGTKDFVGLEYEQIDTLLRIVETEFQNAGGVPLETPVFERADVLLGKYGEEADTKLVYHLEDEGGELLALRYDLTIPSMRYIKENGVKQMRRYSMGKVYRRDQPNLKAGRFREFIQADFDIYGEKQEAMLAEATLLAMISNVFKRYNLSFQILINDVRNLHAMLQQLEIVEWRKCCSIIDKLDKQSFESLRSEFTTCGITEAQQTQLQEYLNQSTPILPETASDYEMLQQWGSVFGFQDNLKFTSSLARGLDYYTGFIWEFKLDGVASTVSAGGRYDTLLGAPAVGISVGISRLASYLPPPTDSWKESYYITTIGNVSLYDKMKILQKIKSQTDRPILYNFTKDDKKLGKVITECITSYIRYVSIVGEDEFKDGKYILKDLKEKTQTIKSIDLF